MTSRIEQLKSWVSKQVGGNVSLQPIQGDASFRHYYRLSYQENSYIAVDAPPDTENNEAFVALSLILQRQGLLVPEIISYDYALGFMLLSDLGQVQLLEVLEESTAKEWYRRVFEVLRQLQLCPMPTAYHVPYFDDAHIQRELGYFDTWCVESLLKLKLSPAEQGVLNDLYAKMQQCFAEQPQVLTHRDFHSRNIMVLSDTTLGLIDYQDAMIAPLTYDLCSLLKDCYIKFSDDFIESMCHEYFVLLNQEKIISIPYEHFKAGFDWVGLQRHLKVLGIFSRLKLRDKKQGYLKDTPRIINYIKEVVPKYNEMSAFEGLFFEKIYPQFVNIWQQEGIDQVA